MRGQLEPHPSTQAWKIILLVSPEVLDKKQPRDIREGCRNSVSPPLPPWPLAGTNTCPKPPQEQVFLQVFVLQAAQNWIKIRDVEMPVRPTNLQGKLSNHVPRTYIKISKKHY